MHPSQQNYFLLYNKISYKKAGSFEWSIPESGDSVLWRGGYVIDCIKLPFDLSIEKNTIKYNRVIRLLNEFVNKDYDPENTKANIYLLDEYNRKELSRLVTELSYWKSISDSLSKNKSVQFRKELLEEFVTKFIVWFRENNLVPPDIDMEIHKSKKSYFHWNDSKDKLIELLNLCIKEEMIEKIDNVEAYAANFINKDFKKLSTLNRRLIHWKNTDTNLAYFLYKLKYKNLISNQNYWKIASDIFIGKSEKKLSNKNLNSLHNQNPDYSNTIINKIFDKIVQ